MARTNVYGETEIEEVLSKARIPNKEIGTYKEHTLTNDDYYTVVLSNGSILLFTAELQDRHKLLPERVKDIAERFRVKR